MDPLLVARHLGEPVDPGLVDGHPVADAQVGPYAGPEGFEAGDDPRAGVLEGDGAGLRRSDLVCDCCQFCHSRHSQVADLVPADCAPEVWQEPRPVARWNAAI